MSPPKLRDREPSQVIDALGEVTGQLSRAERQALDGIPLGPPAREPASSNPAASF
jgi:hypothetical protein